MISIFQTVCISLTLCIAVTRSFKYAVNHQSRCSYCTRCSLSKKDDSSLSRKKYIGRVASFVFGASVLNDGKKRTYAIEKYNRTNGLPPSGFFIQHAVLKVNDMDESLKFWREGLSMRILRERSVNGKRTVFVGYGAETLTEANGGYFSLELSETDAPTYSLGKNLEYIGLILPDKLNTTGLRATDSGGQIIPHWFLEKDYIEISGPDGVTVRVKQGFKRDPFSVIALGTNKLQKTKKYFKKVLGMEEQSQLQKILGPLAGKNLILGYNGGSVNIALVKESENIEKAAAFDKIAILTRSTDSVAEAVAKSAMGTVLFSGEVPGIGTKVVNTIDNESHGVVFVNYDDFEKELQ